MRYQVIVFYTGRVRRHGRLFKKKTRLQRGVMSTTSMIAALGFATDYRIGSEDEVWVMDRGLHPEPKTNGRPILIKRGWFAATRTEV